MLAGSQQDVASLNTTPAVVQDIIPSTLLTTSLMTSSSATVDHQDVIPSTSSTIAVQQDVTPDNIKTSRQRARQAMMSQAERMVKRSRVEFVPGNPGDNVTVPVPLVDRGRGDSRNLLGIILDRDENDLYRIAVRAGILKGKYARNQFDLCMQRLLLENDVKNDVEVSLRCAVQAESNCGGQGYMKCNCAGSNRCQSNRCKCFKNKMKRNSRCHSCLSCDNKK